MAKDRLERLHEVFGREAQQEFEHLPAASRGEAMPVDFFNQTCGKGRPQCGNQSEAIEVQHAQDESGGEVRLANESLVELPEDKLQPQNAPHLRESGEPAELASALIVATRGHRGVQHRPPW